jgi:hypothetical protein
MKRYKFIEQYCKRSNITVEILRNLGLNAYPCECGVAGCVGWQIVTEGQWKTQLDLFPDLAKRINRDGSFNDSILG